MKKIGVFLIISVMLVGMMFTSVSTNMLAADEIPEPKAIKVAADEIPEPKAIKVAADEIPEPKAIKLRV